MDEEEFNKLKEEILELKKANEEILAKHAAALQVPPALGVRIGKTPAAEYTPNDFIRGLI
ncbi:hypothetical protein AGMMS49975_02770 [Clostridia bacterium]|nr:hypothetical protein AGMMS49975_02770 [Clostridia bacterium]